MERVPPQDGTMDEFVSFNHLLEMIKKFETKKGHELGHKKSHKKQMIGISIPWKTWVLIGASTSKGRGEELKKS